jgi:DNA-binding NarL/FixJ family response regulator
MAIKILIYDTDDMLGQAEFNTLAKEGHTPLLVRTDEEVFYTLERTVVDLVIIDTDIHGVPGSGFLFLKKLRERFPNMPYVMTTERNLDDYMPQIMRNAVGNILVKPVMKEPLLNVVEKLVTKQGIFGLQNYLRKVENLRKVRLVASDQVRPTIDRILAQAREWGFVHLDEMVLRILMQEMISNALYHSHGRTLEKLQRDQIRLEEGKFVEVIYGHSPEKFGIGIIDYNGKLSKEKILNTLFDVAEQDRIILNAAQNPSAQVNISDSGRGIDLLRKLSGEFYYNIRRNFMTEILIIFNINYTKDDPLSSINIFEID